MCGGGGVCVKERESEKKRQEEREMEYSSTSLQPIKVIYFNSLQNLWVVHDSMTGGMCLWLCACVSGYVAMHASAPSLAHRPTSVHTRLSMAGSLSASLSISGGRAQWDINYNMQQNHLCKSQWRGGITFLIKFPWLIVIKVSSVNVSSWLSNSGPETVSTSLVIGGAGQSVEEGEGEGLWRT